MAWPFRIDGVRMSGGLGEGRFDLSRPDGIMACEYA